ncbi:MAG: MopE-related protein [Archangium sp.]|nr:MopE-related protein [Archangium sp.]MDP3575295.1 MopE-related protein [Archangium sp.]
MRWLLLCFTLACAPTPGAGEFIFAKVSWERGVTARCFVVRVTAEGQAARTTRPMLRGEGDGPLAVAIFRDGSPGEVSLEALGFGDEACLEPSGEKSALQQVAFVRKLPETGVALRVLTVPISSFDDLDGDGSPTPADCDDGNPLVRPGVPEACGDTFDNDCDDSFDCDDADCEGLSCGLGRICVATGCVEGTCDNGVDDDLDLQVDCVDPDCAMKTCGPGGTCRLGRCLAPTEVRCDDGVDDDGNGAVDCADAQCETRACSDGDGCSTGETCQSALCTGGSARDCSAGLPACLVNLGCDAGMCLASAAPAGTSCAGPCRPAGTCDGDGGCAGTSVVCAPPPGSCFAAGVCQAALDGGCSYAVTVGSACSDDDGCTTQDACLADGGCAGTRLANCEWPYGPSNFDPALIPASDAGIVIDCLEVVLDTTPTPATVTPMGCSANAVLPAPGVLVQGSVLLSASSLFIDAGARLTLVGSRPVIFAVRGDATIAGQLIATSGADLNCAGATGASGTGSGPGGSGGAFGSAGGAGGAGSGTAPGATTQVGGASLIPLQGGCSGGAGAGTGGGLRGRGGGGLQLSCTGALDLSGLIAAPGEGGGGGAGGVFGGGGAGSGGGVLIEATTLRLSSSGRVLALGGGGGEGSGTLSGAAGFPGSRTDGLAAPGGSTASPRGGGGGAGASRTVDAGVGGNGVLQGAGGGGGAGVGRVRFNVTNSCTFVSGSVVSPLQTSADGGCS